MGPPAGRGCYFVCCPMCGGTSATARVRCDAGPPPMPADRDSPGGAITVILRCEACGHRWEMSWEMEAWRPDDGGQPTR